MKTSMIVALVALGVALAFVVVDGAVARWPAAMTGMGAGVGGVGAMSSADMAAMHAQMQGQMGAMHGGNATACHP